MNRINPPTLPASMPEELKKVIMEAAEAEPRILDAIVAANVLTKTFDGVLDSLDEKSKIKVSIALKMIMEIDANLSVPESRAACRLYCETVESKIRFLAEMEQKNKEEGLKGGEDKDGE